MDRTASIRRPTSKLTGTPGSSSNAAALNAAALQDHIARSVFAPSVRLMRPPPRRCEPERVSIFSRGSKKYESPTITGLLHERHVSPTHDPITSALESVLQSFASPQECHCGAFNQGGSLRCTICGSLLTVPDVASTVTTQSQVVKPSAHAPAISRRSSSCKPGDLFETLASSWRCEGSGCEGPPNSVSKSVCGSCGRPRLVVAASRAPTLTLAQQRGLVPAPAPLLTDGEWVSVERR